MMLLPTSWNPTSLGIQLMNATLHISLIPQVAYRLYLPKEKAKAVVFFFHGNAEICTDIGHLKDTREQHTPLLLVVTYVVGFAIVTLRVKVGLGRANYNLSGVAMLGEVSVRERMWAV